MTATTSLLVVLTVLSGLHDGLAASSSISNVLLDELLKENATATVIVTMKNRTSSVLDRLSLLNFENRSDRLTGVANALRQHAAESQGNILGFLASLSPPLRYDSMWITNQIIVRDATLSVVRQLSKFPEIMDISEDFAHYNGNPINLNMDEPDQDDRIGPNEVQWGVDLIQAPAVWSEGNAGEGIVVATIDTGVRYTHEALRANFRQDYGWFDPFLGSALPYDDNGHGTATTSVIAGTTRGVGVAPGAQWISCKALDKDSWGMGTTFLACGQFVACPTLPDGTMPDCSKAPHVVSNSWSVNAGGNPYYVDMVKAWRAAGITVLFSIGNLGPACNTSSSPGDYEDVIGVGATNSADEITSFSSIGPTAVGQRIKPDVVAPGENVRCASKESDTSYGSGWWGTSFSCPHAAGTVALILKANPNLSHDQIKNILRMESDPIKSAGQTCGGIPDTVYPNNHAGYGRINARRAVSLARTLLHVKEEQPLLSIAS